MKIVTVAGEAFCTCDGVCRNRLGKFVEGGVYRLVVGNAFSAHQKGSEFADDVGPEIREALAVRTAYRVARDTNETHELT